MKELYIENKKVLLKQIKEDKYMDLQISVILTKISIAFLNKIENSILKLTWNIKGPWRTKTILKKNKVGVSYFLISKVITKIQ